MSTGGIECRACCRCSSVAIISHIDQDIGSIGSKVRISIGRGRWRCLLWIDMISVLDIFPPWLVQTITHLGLLWNSRIARVTGSMEEHVQWLKWRRRWGSCRWMYCWIARCCHGLLRHWSSVCSTLVIAAFL